MSLTRSLPRCVVPALAALPLLSGCIASSAVSLVTAPVRVGAGVVHTTGGVYDRLTTSQSESDEKRGRDARKRDERLGKLQHDYDQQNRKCSKGDRDACDRADEIRGEIDRLGAPARY